MTPPAPRPDSAPVAVLGAGPAGLTAAYRLVQRDVPVVVFEADEEVGGLARTVVRDGYRFDLGGHRFFTKSAEVEALWEELLGPELLVRPRLSRIYWRGRFIEYPLRPADVFAKVGPLELARSLASYARARLRRPAEAETYEDWVSARFGRRLFELFFKTYTEKVWGVGTDELRAEWAAQRIADLSLCSALRAALPGGGETPKSLIEEFRYPRLGPGQMWEEMARRVEAGGGEIRLGAAGRRARTRGRAADRGPRRRRAGRGLGGDLLDPAADDGRRRRTGAAARGDGRRRRACATATSSPWRCRSTASRRSRTTGSTSTTRGRGSAGSRTSAPGARG